ncbi:MAG TPA: cation:proton antiporter [Pseudonocardiaceae bacterium]|nr:cation:proton antiporter [Pseudonocardiaceae bacterium]
MPALSTQALVSFVLLDLAVILAVARSVGTLCTGIGQPRVVGEILAGVLLGPTLLGPTLWPEFTGPALLHCMIQPGAQLAMPTSPTSCLFPAPARAVIGQLGQLGLLLFSFLTAVELDRASLRSRAPGIALVGPGSVLLPIAMGIPLGAVLATGVFKPASASMPGFTLFVGVMLAATALPVMVRILQERSLSRSPLGCTGIAASAVATLGLFIAASIASSIATGTGGAVRALGLAAAYLGLMLLVVHPLLARFARQPHAGGIGSLAWVLVLVFASGLAAQLAGLTVIVGGFVAGLVLPAQTAAHCAVEQRLGELTRSVLLPIFLAFSGLQTDLTAVPVAAYGGLALLLVAGLVSKWGGGAVLARLSGLSWAESNVLGILMNCPGVIVLVVALVGLQNGVITPALQAGVVLVALIATAMTGPLLNVYLPRLPATSLIAVPPPPVRRLRA